MPLLTDGLSKLVALSVQDLVLEVNKGALIFSLNRADTPLVLHFHQEKMLKINLKIGLRTNKIGNPAKYTLSVILS